MKTANFLKGSSVAPITKEAERIALTMICEGKNEAEVQHELLKLALPVRQGVVNLKQVSQQTRITKAPVATMVNGNLRFGTIASRAANYYNTMLADDDPFVAGDSVKWVYVKSVPQGLPMTDVVAYRDEKEIENFTLDAPVILQKAIIRKLETVYEILGWDLGAATGEPRPADYW